MNIFAQATRAAVRFTTINGVLTLEQLWQLRLEALDVLAKELRKEVRAAEEDSFIAVAKVDGETQLKFDLVKHIIAVKLEEKREMEESKAKAAKRQVLLEALEAKQGEALRSMSEEELRKELKSL